MKTLKRFVMTIAAGAVLACSAPAFQAPRAADAKKASDTKKAAPAAATDAEIADAKAKGLVWVNTSTKVYHKDGEFFGKTKQGKFMTEADATKAGNRAAKPSGGSKKAAAAPAKK